MATFEVGLFIITLGFAFIFTFVPFNTGKATLGFLHITGMILFIVIGVVISSGFEVSATNTMTDGTTTWTETRVLIGGGESTTWMGLLFYGFAVYNLVFFVRDVFQGD